MLRLRAFARFWYEFIVGDDWRVAVGVVMALGVTSLVAAVGLPAWWVLPAAVLVVLPLSVWRAAFSDRRDARDDQVAGQLDRDAER
jgi:hypothetical protein